MSWNRVYRPKQVSDLHLDFVRTQIQRMMESGKIPQALLFAGPKGTGKTSTSRIIGAVVNDPKNAKLVDSVYLQNKKPSKPLSEPDPDSDFSERIFSGNSFVVQEMDAASNRGIDDIRQLKTRAFLPPQEGKMSVFILDEAHMLTTEAFNALLKLLEEPPSHVIFILATTEQHKIPETIVSRCQVVEFKKATTHEITNRLKSILLEENIKFEEEALTQIAQSADGSFRDAIKLLELAAQSGAVTTQEVAIYSSVNLTSETEQLIKHLLNKDEVAVVELFQELREKSVDQKFFHKSVLELLHKSLLQNLQVIKGESILNKTVAQFLLQSLSDSELSSPSPIAHLKLELKILELIDRSKNKSGSGVKKNPQVKNNQSSKSKSTANYQAYADYEAYENFQEPQEAKPYQEYEAAFSKELNQDSGTQDRITTNHFETLHSSQTAESTNYTGDAALLTDNWQDLVETLAIGNSTLSALLRSAKLVSAQDTKAVIGVYYSFHQEQLSQQKSITAIQNCAKEFTGGFVEFEFILIKTPQKAELVEVEQKDPLVVSASQALL